MAFHVIQVILFNIAIKIRTDWGQVQTQCFGEPPLVTKPVHCLEQKQKCISSYFYFKFSYVV